MNIRDRTIEFQQSVLTYKKQNKNHNQFPHQASNDLPQSNPIKTSDFQKNASSIAHEISSTAQLLSKLAILAKRKPMFNDNPVEIAELSFLIKRKIYSIEQSLIDLSKYQRTIQGKEGVVVKRGKDTHHSKNVVNLLNTKMKNISGDFKHVLEQRQQLELANRDRWEKITQQDKLSTQTSNLNDSRSNSNEYKIQNPNITHIQQQQGGLTNGGLEKGNGSQLSVSNNSMYNNSNPFLSSLANEEEDNNNNTTMIQSSSYNKNGDQTLLLTMEEGLLNQDSNNVYLQERDRAMETIESTIQEVGGLFQQLASMVQEQGEVIQRIDANVDDIDLNITGAQRELLKYFDRIKSNRWLAVKIFFIIFVFFLFWVLVN